jgi:hypothetical protein
VRLHSSSGKEKAYQVYTLQYIKPPYVDQVNLFHRHYTFATTLSNGSRMITIAFKPAREFATGTIVTSAY